MDKFSHCIYNLLNDLLVNEWRHDVADIENDISLFFICSVFLSFLGLFASSLVVDDNFLRGRSLDFHYTSLSGL